MKTRTCAILILALFGGLSSSCETIQEALVKPSASLKGFNFGEVTLESATLLFDVEVVNPYPVALPLLDMDYAVASGSSKLFSGEADIQTTIPAKGKKTVSLPAKITYLDLVKAFKDIRPGSKIPYAADLGLSVDAPALGAMRLPLNKTGEVDVPAIPKINEVDWKKVILDKARNL